VTVSYGSTPAEVKCRRIPMPMRSGAIAMCGDPSSIGR
jgi:hypothetical protein